MSLTGYIAQSGIDLSFIFQSGNSGIITGFKLINGQDIGSIFASYSSILAAPTGIISTSGYDINTLFNGFAFAFVFTINGCCLWMDSNDLTTITKNVSNKVSKWVDKSANAFNFIQDTSGNQPTYSTDPSGNGIISFTSSASNYLAGPSNFSIGTSSYSLFVVCSFVSNSVNGTVFAKTLSGSQNGRLFIMRNPNISISYYHPGDLTLADTPNTTYPVNIYQIFELIVNRTEGIDYAFQNGTLLSSKLFTDATNYSNSANLMLIGAYNNSATTPLNGTFLNGTVAEIVSYKSTDMSSITRQRIEGYLAWKWGIQNRLASYHAYRNASPSMYISDTPIPLRIGVSLWLDSTDLTTITKDGSNKVSKWVDKSTNAFQFIQNTAANQPIYTENSQNGKATIAFNSTNSTYLAGPANFSIDTSSFALFAVFKFNDTTSIGTVFAKSLFAAGDGRFFINRDASSILNIFYTHPGSAWLSSTIDTYTDNNRFRMLELIVNRIESVDYAYQNGSQLTSKTISDTTNYTNTTSIMLIGAYNNSAGTGVQAGYYLNGNVAEIIAYKSAHIDKATRETIEGYLAWKWGLQGSLPNTHAYYSSAPT